MLVQNKFIYVSLPRCASTSFMIACGKNNLNIQHHTGKFDKTYESMDWSLSSKLIASKLPHAHESLSRLIAKFGDSYEIISVKRNKYQRFISTYKHVIDELLRLGEFVIAKKLTELPGTELLYFSTVDLQLRESVDNLVSGFLEKFELNKFKNIESQKYLRTMLNIVFSPISFYHNDNSRILWFDFEKLGELESWVSNKLSMDFKLEKTNSSKHLECNLTLDSTFIEKYDSIYGPYEIVKTFKTLV